MNAVDLAQAAEAGVLAANTAAETAEKGGKERGENQGKRKRDDELRGGTGHPLSGMSVEGVEAILQRNQGAQRRRVAESQEIDSSEPVLRQDVICAGPGPPGGGVHSATGYFEKQLRSQPGYDQDYLTNNKVARDERVDVLEELRFREPDHSFATCERHGFGYARIRRRDGVQGWIRCQYLREVCTEVEPAVIKKHQERERQRELEIEAEYCKDQERRRQESLQRDIRVAELRKSQPWLSK
jgi:hypothetical protein